MTQRNDPSRECDLFDRRELALLSFPESHSGNLDPKPVCSMDALSARVPSRVGKTTSASLMLYWLHLCESETSPSVALASSKESAVRSLFINERASWESAQGGFPLDKQRHLRAMLSSPLHEEPTVYRVGRASLRRPTQTTEDVNFRERA